MGFKIVPVFVFVFAFPVLFAVRYFESLLVLFDFLGSIWRLSVFILKQQFFALLNPSHVIQVEHMAAGLVGALLFEGLVVNPEFLAVEDYFQLLQVLGLRFFQHHVVALAFPPRLFLGVLYGHLLVGLVFGLPLVLATVLLSFLNLPVLRFADHREKYGGFGVLLVLAPVFLFLLLLFPVFLFVFLCGSVGPILGLEQPFPLMPRLGILFVQNALVDAKAVVVLLLLQLLLHLGADGVARFFLEHLDDVLHGLMFLVVGNQVHLADDFVNVLVFFAALFVRQQRLELFVLFFLDRKSELFAVVRRKLAVLGVFLHVIA